MKSFCLGCFFWHFSNDICTGKQLKISRLMSYYWYGTLSFLIFISFFFLYLDRIKRNWTNAFWVISTTNLNNINGFNRYKIYCVNGVNFFECAETEFCSTVNLISHRISATAAFSNQICNIRILTHTHTCSCTHF